MVSVPHLVPCTLRRLIGGRSKQSDAILPQQGSDYAKLDSTLRHFIEAVAAGETRLGGLISEESELIKEHVTLRTGQLRDDIYTRVASESDKTRLAISEMSTRVTSEAFRTRHELSMRMMEMTASQASAAEHHQLLKSIQYATMNERRNQIVESHEDSFQWIFGPKQDNVHSDAESDDFERLSEPENETDDDEWEQFYNGSIEQSLILESSRSFLRWLHSEGPMLYWISGKAESGKSTLMKFLVDEPRTRAELGVSTVLSHFLWMAGQPMDRSIRGSTCSLLHQLLLTDPGLSAVILNQISGTKFKNFYSDWSVKELDAAILAAFAASPNPICIFLDGLDEIDPSERPDKVLDLVDRLCRVPRLRLCVSSRPEPAFQRRLDSFPALRLQDLTRRDIGRYTLGILRPYFSPEDAEFREFVQRVCEKSDGVFLWVSLVVFLWVSLVVKSLQRGMDNADTPAELRKRLESLPNDLYQLYDSMWRRLNEDEPIYREDGAKFLNYVLSADVVYQESGKWAQDPQVSAFVLMLARDAPLRHEILEKNTGRPQRSGSLA